MDVKCFKKQKFAHVYENGRDLAKFWKKQGTSLKTNENVDTCTRTVKIWGESMENRLGRISKNLTRETLLSDLEMEGFAK